MGTLAELVTQAQAGDREAANMLAIRSHRFIYGIALRHMKNHADADAIAQDVLIHAYLKLGQLNCNKAYLKWLERITYHMAMNDINSRRQHVEITDHASNHKDVHAVLINQEEAKTLRKAVKKLTPKYRIALTEFYFKQKQIDKIAKEQNVPVGTIKRRLHTARLLLREYYEEKEQDVKTSKK